MLRGYEGEIVHLRGTVSLVVAPAVLVGVTPLRRIVREVVNPQSTLGLVVAPSVSVRIEPLCRFKGEGVRAVVDGPVLIPVGIAVHVRIYATETI